MNKRRIRITNWLQCLKIFVVLNWNWFAIAILKWLQTVTVSFCESNKIHSFGLEKWLSPPLVEPEKTPTRTYDPGRGQNYREFKSGLFPINSTAQQFISVNGSPGRHSWWRLIIMQRRRSRLRRIAHEDATGFLVHHPRSPLTRKYSPWIDFDLNSVLAPSRWCFHTDVDTKTSSRFPRCVVYNVYGGSATEVLWRDVLNRVCLIFGRLGH